MWRLWSMIQVLMFFAANSEAVKGQRWNIPSSHLVSIIWTLGEKLGCWERSQLYWTSFTLSIFPSKSLTLQHWNYGIPFQQIIIMAGLVKSDLVSYIPSVSWFLWVILKGKAPLLFLFPVGQTENVTSWQDPDSSAGVWRGKYSQPFLKLSQVVQREVHCRRCRNCLPKQ